MIGIGEVAAGIGSLQAAASIIKGLNAANTQASINDVKLGLQGHILDAQAALMKAQEAQTALTNRVRELEQEIMKLNNWEAEKQCYELKAVDTGVLAYMPKLGLGN